MILLVIVMGFYLRSRLTEVMNSKPGTEGWH